MKTFSLMSDPDKKLTLYAYELMVFDIDFRIMTKNYKEETIKDVLIKKQRLNELINSIKSEINEA